MNERLEDVVRILKVLFRQLGALPFSASFSSQCWLKPLPLPQTCVIDTQSRKNKYVKSLMVQLPKLGDTVSKLSTPLQDRDRTKDKINSGHSGLLCKGSRSSRGKFPTRAWDKKGCGLRGEKGRRIRVRLYGFNIQSYFFLCSFMARTNS